MECPFCKLGVKNIKLHFDKRLECAKNIDMVHFSKSHYEYVNIIAQEKAKLKRQRILEMDPDYYRKAKKKSRAKQQAEDPIKYRETQQEVRQKQLDADSNYYNKAMKKTRAKQQANIGETERRCNFNFATMLGPIFPCSCCERELYEKGVTKITDYFKENIETKKKGLFSFCITEEIHIEININGSFNKSGSYICGTCKAALLLALFLVKINFGF